MQLRAAVPVILLLSPACKADPESDDETGVSESGESGETGEPTGGFDVEPAVFADVDGDGADDAIVVSRIATGGTGRFSQVTVFAVRAGAAVVLAEIAGGDRGDGGIRRVAGERGAVIVERNVLAEGDGLCCPSAARRERWRWSGGALVEDEAARQPIAP